MPNYPMPDLIETGSRTVGDPLSFTPEVNGAPPSDVGAHEASITPDP